MAQDIYPESLFVATTPLASEKSSRLGRNNEDKHLFQYNPLTNFTLDNVARCNGVAQLAIGFRRLDDQILIWLDNNKRNKLVAARLQYDSNQRAKPSVAKQRDWFVPGRVSAVCLIGQRPSYLLVVAIEKSLFLWHLPSGQLHAKFTAHELPISGIYAPSVTCRAAAYFLTVSKDLCVKFWSVARLIAGGGDAAIVSTPKPMKTVKLTHSVSALCLSTIALSRGRANVFIGARNGVVHLVDGEGGGRECGKLFLTSEPTALAVDKCGLLLFAGLDDGSLQRLYSFEDDAGQRERPPRLDFASDRSRGAISSLSLNVSSTLLVAAQKSSLSVFETHAGVCLKSLTFEHAISAAAFVVITPPPLVASPDAETGGSAKSRRADASSWTFPESLERTVMSSVV